MERRPLERVEPALPATWYRDPAHYQRELEVFWYAKWIAVAREEEIPGAGDWRVVRIGTQSIVLLRNEAGELRAFHKNLPPPPPGLGPAQKGHFSRQGLFFPQHPS